MDVPEIRDLFSWARIEAVTLKYTVGGGDNQVEAAELIISNPPEQSNDQNPATFAME